MKWLRDVPARIDLEFGREPPASTRAGWLLLLIAVVFAADVGRSYLALRDEYASLSAKITSIPGSELPAQPRYQPKDLDREMIFARTTIRHIALPWNPLFKALGASDSEGVALLAVEPDADNGSIEITATAKDLPAMLTYLARLEANPFFPTVVLTRHELKKNNGPLPIYFVVDATWRNR
jgi:hypothetical protein